MDQSIDMDFCELPRLSPSPAIADADIDGLLLLAVAEALVAPSAHKGRGLCDWQLKRVTGYIDRHIGDPITVRELAAVAKLSPGHFTRAFAARVGTTPRTYLIRERLKYARELMLDSSQQLADIAFQCGMADHPHLCRLFRREVGKTPSQWRRESLAATRH